MRSIINTLQNITVTKILFGSLECVMRSVTSQLLLCPALRQSRDPIISVSEYIRQHDDHERLELSRVHLPPSPPPLSHGRKSDFLILPPLLLQGLSVVPPVLGTVPIIEGVLLGLGLYREVGVVSHHGVHVIIRLVILKQHSVLLGGRRALLVVNGIGTRLPHIVPGGRTPGHGSCCYFSYSSIFHQQTAAGDKRIHFLL